MHQIKRIETGEVFTVSQEPIWVKGTWECGDVRFMDQSESEFEVVPNSNPVFAVITVSPVEFKLLWSPQERATITGLKATDPIVADFYSVIDDPRLTLVNLSLASTQQAVDYLLSKLVEATIITEADAPVRREAILSGAFQ